MPKAHSTTVPHSTAEAAEQVPPDTRRSAHPAHAGVSRLSRSPSLVARLLRHAHEAPDRPALRFQGQQTSWADHRDAVLRTARDLRSRGVRTGDRVALLLTNRPEFLTVTHAAAAIGAITVPVNFRLTPDEVSYILGHSSPRVLVTEPRTRELAEGAVARLAAASEPPSDGAEAPASGPALLDCADGWLARVIADGALLAADDIHVPHDDDDCAILYTSGTTGRPKGAVLSYLNLYNGGVQNGLRWGADDTSTVMLAPPLFHVGSFMSSHAALAAGAASLVIPSAGFDAAATLATMKDEDVTSAFMIPQQWHLLCDEIERTASTDLSLTHASWGGAPATEKLLRRMAACMPRAQITAVFGQTETCGTAVSLSFEDSLTKIGSVGRPTAETWIRIVDPSMNDVGVDAVGEIVYRGTCVMNRYWDDPAATAEAFAGGWFHSGDLVRRDADGFLYVVDRIKDMIISGGENIYCAEVENALSRHPDLAEVTVVGRPDDAWGEVPVACIVPVEGAAPPTLEDLRGFLNDRLARYKHPKDLVVLDQLPRTGMGKIQKTALRSAV